MTCPSFSNLGPCHHELLKLHELDIIWLVVIFGKDGDDKKNQISSIAYQDDLHHLLVAMFKPDFF